MRAPDARIGRLLLYAGGRALREIVIDRRRLAIGRRQHNDLLLDDLTVSGEHAIIHTLEGGSIIHDLKSRNGTLVNGRPVMQCDLNDGDVVEVGIYRLEYRSEPLPGVASWIFPSRQGATNRDGARTSAWNPGGSMTGSTMPVTRSAGQSVRRDERIDGIEYGIDRTIPPAPVLRWLGGDDAGREQVIDRPIVSIRNGLGQVAVVGRRHAGWCLTHMEGLAYPLVNGEAIGLAAHPLRDNDLIELAGTIIQFTLS